MQKPEGLTHVLILMLLEEEPSYGYEIMKRIEDMSGGYWCPGQGTVYGAIEKLESKGMIEEVDYSSGDADERNYYGLTEKGEQNIKEGKEHLENDVKPLDRILGLLHIYRYFCEQDFSRVLDGIREEFSEEINSEE